MRTSIFAAMAVLALLLTACGQSSDKAETKTAEPTTSTAPAAAPAPESAPADKSAAPTEGAAAP